MQRSVFLRRHLIFTARIWLRRFGLHNHLERWRLDRLIAGGQPHESDFAFFRRLEGSTGLFVDIGANIGQSALSFRLFNKSCPILSFEPNPDLAWHLQRVRARLGSGFDYRIEGLGAAHGVCRYYLPVVAGVPLTQEASVFPERFRSSEYARWIHERTGRRHFDIEERVLRIVPFDDLGLRAAVVKIDAQGSEADILRGMKETLKRDRPLVLMENDWNGITVLQGWDYETMAYRPVEDRLVPWQQGSGGDNYFCVPREQLGVWTQDLARAG